MAADMMPDGVWGMLAIADLALLSIHCPTATPLSIVHILVGTGQLAWARLIYRPTGVYKDKAVHFTPGT